MDTLAKIAESVREFAASAGLTLVPAVPVHDFGPEILLGPEVMALPGFLVLAQEHGRGLLYLDAAPFDPGTDGDGAIEVPPELVRHRGQVGLVSVAFTANGLVHFWEDQAPWYRQWRDAVDAASRRWRRDWGDDDGDEFDRLSPEERDRLVTEMAATLLEMTDFRAAKPGSRQRVAEFAMPADTDREVRWAATRKASEQAENLSHAAYAQINERLEEVSAQLITTEPWQRASSPAALKQVVEQFLIPLADGFFPPTLIRDEVYAKARALAKGTR